MQEFAAWVRRFLSTPSARRATERVSIHCKTVRISIHALREEGDFGASAACACWGHFYPRPPREGRRAAVCAKDL